MPRKKLPPAIEDDKRHRREKLILPEPKCIYGFTNKQIQTIMGNRLEAFQKWMRGQTVCCCPGMSQGCDNTDHRDSTIVFEEDVVRFLKGLPIVD